MLMIPLLQIISKYRTFRQVTSVTFDDFLIFYGKPTSQGNSGIPE
jgi:hypothetical protein